MPGARRITRSGPGRVAMTLAMVSAVVAVSCTESDPETVEPVVSGFTTTTTTVPPWPSDGVLRLGVLLPTTGALASIGQPMTASIEHAVTLINDAGGVLGQPVELVVADEGSSVASAIIGFDTLIADGVDAIIGPLSSLSALGALARSVSAGVLTCSPSASAQALDTFPANGLLARTIPSDSLQAQAMARQAEQTGGTSAVIAMVDDTFGRPFARALQAELELRGLEVLETVGFRADEENLDRTVDALLAQSPDVLLTIGDAESILVLLETTADATPATIPPIITNDALRTLSGSAAIRGLPRALRERLLGVGPAVIGTLEEGDPVDLAAPFAAHAFDCANLLALATERSGVDDPTRMAAQLAGVSSGGAVCRTFVACASRLGEGLQIDYSGRSGAVDLGTRNNSVTRGRFEEFRFDSDGVDSVTSAFDITAR